MMTELLAHGNDRVVRAMSGALRNLAIDARNRDLLGESFCGSEPFHTPRGRGGRGSGRTLNSCPGSFRSTRGASSGGQLARRRPESTSAGAFRGHGGIGAEHAARGAGFQPGCSQDPAGLAGDRETGAHQQRRVSGGQNVMVQKSRQTLV